MVQAQGAFLTCNLTIIECQLKAQLLDGRIGSVQIADKSQIEVMLAHFRTARWNKLLHKLTTAHPGSFQ